MAKVGALEVKTVKTIHGKARVVKLPGHRFDIEHFFPNNCHSVREPTQRVRIVQSAIGSRPVFVAKQSLPGPLQTRRAFRLPLNVSTTQSVFDEARIARFANSLGVKGIKVEEPLAIVSRKPGKIEVIYRFIPGTPRKPLNSHYPAGKLIEKLNEQGIKPRDYSVIVDAKGVVHLIDLETWTVSEEMRRKLGLKSQVK